LDAVRKEKERISAPVNRVWLVSPSEPLVELSPRAEVRFVSADFLLNQHILAGYSTVTSHRFSKTHKVHNLMCETFHGPRPSPHHVADHIFENKLHNCRSQLRWSDANTELATGQRCERQLTDGSWQRFSSYLSAGRAVVMERYGLHVDFPIFGPQTESDSKSFLRLIRSAGCVISQCARGNHSTAYGFKWRALQRGPDVQFVCEDCEQTFTRRGDWLDYKD
jgi:hypothetical protein